MNVQPVKKLSCSHAAHSAQNVNNRKKSRWGVCFRLLLAFCLAATMAPIVATPQPAQAEPATNKAVVLGAAGLVKNKLFYFGTYKNQPVQWRVLSPTGGNGTSTAPATYKDASDRAVGAQDAMFLLSEYSFDGMTFADRDCTADDTNEIKPTNWKGSNPQKWCSDTFPAGFTADEKSYLLKTSKDASLEDYSGKIGTTKLPDGRDQNSLSNDEFFILSYYELLNYVDPTGYLDQGKTPVWLPAGRTDWVDGWWSLRAPITYNPEIPKMTYNERVAILDKRGLIDRTKTPMSASPNVRPAFNLNRSYFENTLFTVPVSRSVGTVGSTLAANGGASNELKLVNKDASRVAFGVTTTNPSAKRGDTVQLNYTGATTGANEYISAMIVNSATKDVLYYGQLAEVGQQSSGSVNFTVPADINAGSYELRLFNEQITDSKAQDKSSDFTTLNFTVEKADPKASDFNFTAPGNPTYDGQPKTASVTAKQGVAGMGDVTVKYFQGDREVANPTNAGTYTVKIDVTEGAEHKAVTGLTDASWTFTIAKAGSQTAPSTSASSVTYGDKLKLTAQVSRAVQQQSPIRRAPRAPAADKVEFFAGEGDNAVSLGAAEVSYDDPAKKDSGSASITVDTKDKRLNAGSNIITAQYGGSVNLNNSGSSNITITLDPKPVTLTWSGADERIFDGNASKVTATATGFETNDDVQVAVSDGTEAGVGTHTATASLTGSAAQYYTLQNPTQQYTITAQTIQVRVQDIPAETYNGRQHRPPVHVFYGENEIPSNEYNVQYSDNTNAGEAKVTITGNNNYSFSASTTFTINPLDITETQEKAATTMLDSLKYTGEPQTPTGEVHYDGYTVTGTWKEVTNVSDPWVFTANGNFTGTITRTSQMSGLPITIEWDGPDSFVYDGKPHRVYAKVVGAAEGDLSKINIVLFDQKAVSRDVPIEKTDVGNYETWVYDVEGIGRSNYSISLRPIIRKNWKITQATNTLSDLSLEGWSYSDTPNDPQVTAQFGTPTFEYATEQNGAYSEEVPTAAGTYWVRAKVDGTNNYTAVQGDPVQFQIAQKDIAEAKVELEAAPVYNGQEQAQNVAKVEVDGKELTAGVDYQVSDNTATDVKADGAYTLTITGKGNYTGAKTVEWNIAPATPAENPAKKTAAKSFKGKPLSQAAVTEGEILGVDGQAIAGTFTWEDGSKLVSAAGTQRMVFTPADATNYASLTFDVEVSFYTLADVNIDTDGDGKPDINIDTNGDGKPDLNIDVDGDGTPDINIVDKDGDGKPDTGIDPGAGVKPDLNIDTNGDGKADLNIDTNGDGKPDLNIDVDGDGVADLNIDTDGDGKPDKNIDADGDGKPDRADSKSTTKTTTTTTTTSNVNGDNNTSASPQSGDTLWPWAVLVLVLISAAVVTCTWYARMYRASYAGKRATSTSGGHRLNASRKR